MKPVVLVRCKETLKVEVDISWSESTSMVLFLLSEVMLKTGPPRHLDYFEVQDLPIQLAILVFLCNKLELILFFKYFFLVLYGL